MSKVWLITGCSTGFGREITLAALKRGDKVVATGRTPSKLEDLAKQGALTEKLDVTWKDEEMKSVVSKIIDKVGQIDILINNAGYGLVGCVEECSAEEVQAQFATNVFGQLTVLRAVLPYMRARRSGVVANMGSVSGWKGMVSGGFYCATKAATALFTDALRDEVAGLGIEVTTLEPGKFRTRFLNSGNIVSAQRSIPDMAETREAMNQFLRDYAGKQQGDPTKGAQLIVEALTKSGRCAGRELPHRLLIGVDTVESIEGFLDEEKKTLAEWRDLVSTTDFDDVK